MADEEFWRLTPRQFKALTDRLDESRQREDFRFGVLASVVANVNRDPKVRAEPWDPADFFYLPDIEKAPAEGHRMTTQQIKAVAHYLTGFAQAKARDKDGS